MKQELVSQYSASLKMLIQTISKCPDELWDDTNHQSPYWQIVYHSLHFTALYLSDNETLFSPWAGHRLGAHQLGNSAAIIVSQAYLKIEMEELARQIIDTLHVKIYRQDMEAPSGFEWLPMNKFELHLYNLRHLQHHIGQLVERLHSVGIYGVDWIGSIN
ncbi:hypothetical protein MUY27_07410 [Mucilaginibacter sp. RS28]|uniref:DinB family protein n=1 Tax=Mucilaginibacter straminoryzae TaxID=2932774 RepID=A0A9X1X296_9SPHI|nr:hypothetical protein [Mucilaginibacter straminoryzae]MCJ8209531.1 hypothetical protein [Mucilaginibacter straminoryzae]